MLCKNCKTRYLEQIEIWVNHITFFLFMQKFYGGEYFA